MMDLPHLGPVEPGRYYMDPDLDPDTPLRVVYEIPVDGWSHWLGTVKFGEDGHVALTITTVNNLVIDGCSDHSHADPPIGPTLDDLAIALSELAPFQVTSPPQDVTVSVGDQVIDTFKVADKEPVMRKVSIPAEQLGTGDMVEMKIDTGQSFVPAQTPAAKSSDQRELGVRVFHAFVEAK